MVRQLRRGMFLQEAGAEQFAYWPNEQAQLGARVMNVGPAERTVEVRMTIRDAHTKVLLSQSTELTVPARESRRWDKLTATFGPEPATYSVSTELLREGTVIDRIEHEINVLDTRVPARQEFMTVQGTNFVRDGRPWYPVGVNYWPLYVSGMDHADFWAGWLPPRYYDPALVEQDLTRLETLGINLVSIQAPDKQFHRNLLDFVRRCEKHGVFVNLFCGLASPLAFQEKELKDFLTTTRLADNPTIMAYDTFFKVIGAAVGTTSGERGSPSSTGASRRPKRTGEWRDGVIPKGC
jgi:hypothetical protein